jgi:hypothetical protein
MYEELKKAAEAARMGSPWFLPDALPVSFYQIEKEFICAATPSVVLALIAELEKIDGDRKACWAEFKVQGRAMDQLKAENEEARMRIKELDLLLGRYILAMRAAVIEEEHGNGLIKAMEWIYNSLAGPGQLPPEGATDAQAYFDAEIVAVDNGMQEVLAFHDARRKAKEAAM